MKRNKLICLTGVIMLSLCGCESNDNKRSDELIDEVYDLFLKPRVAVYVYDENGEMLQDLNDRYDEEVTFYTNTTYILKVYINHTQGTAEYPDYAISFEYDEEYISLVDCCEDFDWNNTYYFTGLKEVDETTLIIHHRAVTEAKILLITLVDSLEIDNE